MFNRGVLAALSLLFLSGFAGAQERGSQVPILSGPNAQLCFEPTPNAGADTCLKRISPGVVNITPGIGNGSAIGGGVGGAPTLLFTVSISAGTITATANSSAVTTVTGTDICAVLNPAMAQAATTGGRIFFKQGQYPMATVTAETRGFGNPFYCAGIPSTGTVTQGVEWYFTGESQPPFAGIAASQTGGGVVFLATAAQRTSAGAGNLISYFWQRPDAGGTAALNQVYFEDISIRLLDNQRGNENHFDMSAAVGASWIGGTADFVGAYNTHLAPVAGTNGQRGFVTNRSNQNLTYLRNTLAEGMDEGYEINSEHSQLIQTTAYQNRFPYSYGMVGATIFHASEWFHPIEFNCINGLRLGSTLAKGSQLIIKAYDKEYTASGAFALVGASTEANPGFTTGVIYKTTVQGGVGVINPGVMFTAGQGINISVIDSGKRLAPGLVSSNFVSAATTGTTKQTLASYTVPDGPQGSDGSIFQNGPGNVVRVKVWGITAANANSKTVTIDFGGTTIATLTSTASAGAIELEADIIAEPANVQECIGKGDDGTVRTVSRTAGAVTSTAAIIIAATATTPTASGDFTFKGLTIEYLVGTH